MKRPNEAGRISAAIPVLLLLAIAGGFLLRYLIATPESPAYATVLPTPTPLPDFALSRHDGDPFVKKSFEGRFSLVFFGFTNCPDICPVTLQQLAVARRRMAVAEPDSPLPEIVFVSVDPGRDTEENLGRFVRAFGDGVIGVRGDPAELQKLAGAFGVYFKVDPGDGENYSVAHSAAVVVVNQDAEFQALFGAPHDIDAFVHDLPIIIASK